MALMMTFGRRNTTSLLEKMIIILISSGNWKLRLLYTTNVALYIVVNKQPPSDIRAIYNFLQN